MSSSVILPSLWPVACHTDHIMPGGTFVAIAGFKHDGASYIPVALSKGAQKIVIQKNTVLTEQVRQQIKLNNAELVMVDDARLALAQLSIQAAGAPAKKLRIIGITGTKGKTTTSFLIEHILRTAGYKTALLTTVYNKILDTVFAAPLTTAQPDYLQQFLKTCVDNTVEWVVMETAAQAFSLHRVEGILFDGVIFTNFSQEHAEFYPTMSDYFAAKSKIFAHAKPGAPILINSDNEWLAPYVGSKNFISLSLNDSTANFFVKITQSLPHLQMHVWSAHDDFELHCPALLGSYNGYNCAMAVSMARLLSVDVQTSKTALESFTGVPGRLQRYQLPNGATCFIDYAHNPSSFEQLFTMLRSMTHQLIVVFGAGGERDRTKRPIMGALAASFADQVILTTDNPRSEDPREIVEEIRSGIPLDAQHKVIIELDRAKAIHRAYSLVQPTGVIALLGKGPEEYQIIGSQKIYFSEAAVVQSLV